MSAYAALGGLTLTLPNTPQIGDWIDVADAFGQWASDPIVVARNGHLIEGVQVDFVNNAAGTFFRLLYVGADTGWRILASGTRPINLVAPTISGTPAQGSTLTATNGSWTGNPTAFSYQWQRRALAITEVEIIGDAAAVLSNGNAVVPFGNVTELQPISAAGGAKWELLGPDSQSAVWETQAEGAIALADLLNDWGSAGGILFAEVFDDTKVRVVWETEPDAEPESDGGNGELNITNRNFGEIHSWQNVAGATNQTYVLGAQDLHKQVRCMVSAANANGTSVSSASNASGVVYDPGFPLAGLLAFWKLSDLADASGNGNTLTNNNGVTFGPGKIGDAAEFDGTNWLQSGSVNIGSENFSLSAWVYLSAGSGEHVIFNTPESDSPVFLKPGPSGWDIAVYPQAMGLTAGALSADQWYHIAVVSHRSAKTIDLWVDGVKVLTEVDPSLTWPIPDEFSPALSLHGSLKWVGKIDAAGIWNRALTDEEITLLYNAGAGLEPV
jgi:hypothetical protein